MKNNLAGIHVSITFLNSCGVIFDISVFDSFVLKIYIKNYSPQGLVRHYKDDTINICIAAPIQ